MSSNSTNATRLSLLQRIRNDDSRAWSELVELYGPLISYWCRQHGLDRELSRDCVQEVFFSLLKSMDQYAASANRGSFRKWLWAIARNKIVDLLRQQRRQMIARGGSTANQFAQQIAAEDEPSEVEPTDDSQIKLLLQRGLNQVQAEFEPKTWQAFWRTTVDSIPTSIVASDLGVTTAAIRQYRSRVLRRLRQQLGDLS